MADTLTTQSATPATVPSATVIATDDAGAGGHVQIVKLAISTDGSATPLTADNTNGLLVKESGTHIQVDDAAFTPATSKVNMVGYEADETGTDSVDEGDGGAARMTLDRKQIVNPQPHTAGGLSTFNATSGDSFTALTATAQAVKASAGQLYGWYIYNPNSSATYVIIYNVAQGSVTVGTTNPLIVLCIPALSAANVMGIHGIIFDTAIAVAAATTGGGNSAPAIALECMLFYK